MTSGSHAHPAKYLIDAWRTVRRPRADCPRGRCYRPVATGGALAGGGGRGPKRRRAGVERAVRVLTENRKIETFLCNEWQWWLILSNCISSELVDHFLRSLKKME